MKILNFTKETNSRGSFKGVIEAELPWGIVVTLPIFEKNDLKWTKIPRHGTLPALTFRSLQEERSFKAAVLAALDKYEGEVR